MAQMLIFIYALIIVLSLRLVVSNKSMQFLTPLSKLSYRNIQL